MIPADRQEVERITNAAELRMIGLVKFLVWCFGIPMIAGATLLVAHIWLTGMQTKVLEAQVRELKEGKR